MSILCRTYFFPRKNGLNLSFKNDLSGRLFYGLVNPFTRRFLLGTTNLHYYIWHKVCQECDVGTRWYILATNIRESARFNAL